MKILAVAELYPWPAVDGYRQRLEHLLSALGRVGEVDLFTPAPADGSAPVTPPIEGIATVVTAPTTPRSARDWMSEWSRSDLPRRMFATDWTEARRELGAWGPEPDLVWYSQLNAWVAVGDLFPHAGSIVDFDNLENLAMGLRRRQAPRFHAGSTLGYKVRSGARWAGSRAMDLVDERRWDATQRRCSQEVDQVVVCSPLDVERSGCDNAVAIPNGADVPDGPQIDRTQLLGDAPTMLFVAALDYEPNTDAVEWFVDKVLPLVRLRIPGAVARIVGRGSDKVGWVAGVPGVELVGEVDHIRPELDRADVSIVPIRVGAGTRLKVIEAMAHHIPMVSTTVGCEGIELLDGTHALIADDPLSFADACLKLLSDGQERQTLADNGAALFEEFYTWDAIGERVAGLVGQVASPDPEQD